MGRKFSITAQIAEVDYELGQRATVYKRIKQNHPSHARECDEHVAVMEAVKTTLEWIGDNREAIEAWIIAGKPGRAA